MGSSVKKITTTKLYYTGFFLEKVMGLKIQIPSRVNSFAAHNAMDLFLSQQSAQPTLLDHPTTQ
jgi:hypothetical protein